MRAESATRNAILVREWTSGDDAFVARLADEAFSEYAGRPAPYLLRITHQANTRTWVALDAGVPVGLVVVELASGAAAVLAVAVARRARARGIGGQLMHVAERHAFAGGVRRLTLFTADANLAALDLAALDLFLRRGFRIIARKPGFYARGQDACQLEKTR
jgi:ribosomal protein S18 acetylase RimI-like enzyme